MIAGPLLGAHMSIAGGIHRAFEHAAKAGCTTLQVFLKNSNQWKGKRLSGEDRSLYLEAQERSGISPVVAHSSYLINLASPDPDLYEKSLSSLVDEMMRANFLGIPSLVLHPGSHRGSGEKEGISRIASALDRALGQVGPPVRIVLENTAGQGSSVGHRFEQLRAILERTKEAGRIGVCIDTCHAFAAGYDIRTERGFRKTIAEFDRLIGSERILVFHLNDCRRELGSRVDRHTHIGQGFLGLEVFRCLVNDPRFAGAPKILETPKGADLEEDIMNLATLRSLIRAPGLRTLRGGRRA
jgi:deoxyribonuclease IV